MTKRPFNRTRVAKKNCPKKKVLKTNKGLLRMRIKSKNENPEYSRRGTRAKGKTYDGINFLARVAPEPQAPTGYEEDCD